jgi:anti-sigma factor RsiW
MNGFFERAPVKRECRWAQGHMSDYLDEDLAGSRRSRMQRHLKKCPECHGVLTTLRRVVRALHRLPPPGGGADAIRIADSVRRRLGEPPPP